MNWGNKIILVFAVFVSGILYMVFKAGTYNTDLVTNDYYEQELKYQQTIDAVERTNALTAPVTCTVSAEQIAIQFPAEMKNDDLEADVWLYCIADKQKDIKRKFTTKEGKIIMPVLPANKGLHEIKMSWVSKGQTYYYKQKIVLK
jgi:hypothetical protein